MKHIIWVIGGLFSLLLWGMPASVSANCVVTATETFSTGTYVADDKCDTTGAKKITLNGASGGDPANTRTAR